jgi:hypothetical protein
MSGGQSPFKSQKLMMANCPPDKLLPIAGINFTGTPATIDTWARIESTPILDSALLLAALGAGSLKCDSL